MSPPVENPAPLSADEPIEEIEDPERLLALAKAYRAGSDGLPRDLEKCFGCYRAAAELGSADAEYALAVFYMTGLVVPQDVKQAAARLRVAADGGVVPAKIYFANLYELGIHFKADPEKANVWYRNAARAAGIKDDLDSPDGVRALARLGSVRHALELTEIPEVSSEERDACLAKAKTLGYQLKLREEARASSADAPAKSDSASASDLASASVAGSASAPAAPPTGSAKSAAPESAKSAAPEQPQKPAAAAAKSRPKPDPRKERQRARRNQRLLAELAAFGLALFMAAIGVAAAYGAHHAALGYFEKSRVLPVFGERLYLVFPSVLFAVGALPSLLAYRVGAFIYALFGGAVIAAIGWRVWHTAGLALASSPPIQAALFGIGGFLLTLIALGFTRGAARRSQL